MKGTILGKLVLMTCILIGLLVVPACAENLCITRNATDLTYAGNSFEVTINLKDLRAGGIIETIPSGMTFVSTTHPEERYEREEQNIVFSVVDDDSIGYTLRAGSTGQTTITGIWYDTLTKRDGRIADTSLTVYAHSSGGSGDSGETAFATTSPLILNAEGSVSTPIQLKSADQRAILDIPVDVCAHCANGKPIHEVGIAHLKNFEIGELGGTDFLFEKYAYRCSPAGAIFNPAINLSFTFTQEEWDSFPEEKVLRIQHYDPEKKEWIPLPTTIDEESRSICTFTTHFSIFGIFTGTQALEPTEKISEDAASRIEQTSADMGSVSKDDANVPEEKTDASIHVPTFTAPDKADEKTNMNPLFFVAALIVAIIGVAAVVVMKKNGEEKED